MCTGLSTAVRAIGEEDGGGYGQALNDSYFLSDARRCFPFWDVREVLARDH